MERAEPEGRRDDGAAKQSSFELNSNIQRSQKLRWMVSKLWR
jgi:hypothetical protein